MPLASGIARQVEPIAIVGMDCALPGAPDLPSLWKLLVAGRDAIQVIPASRWDVEAFFHPDPQRRMKTRSRWGGFVPRLETFDAGFFGIPVAEAARMDPQQKLFLEVAYSALENAGLAVTDLSGSDTGVFAGIGHAEHDHHLKQDLHSIDQHTGVQSFHCFSANRVSYHLNLQGPSLAVDTACSSSLVAVHLACQSLRVGECDLALAGGVNAQLGPEESISTSAMGLLSADGRCRSFDASAQGFARSEGCGVVVLMRLADALANGNEIWAVIRGSAVCHNGKSNGITAPNGPAQHRVIERALGAAGVSAAEVDYVEAHGTATPLGDRLELSAIDEVLCRATGRVAPCTVGSIKTNIGHLEASAGIAGLIKVVLAMQNQLIPRSLHFVQFGEDLKLDPKRIRVATENLPWPKKATSRIGGVSAFGFGGSNCHMLLEEAPQARDCVRASPRDWHLLTLSAKSEDAMQRLKSAVAEHLRTTDDELADVCYSLNTGRTAFPIRCATWSTSKIAMASQLQGVESSASGGHTGRAPRIAPRVLVYEGMVPNETACTTLAALSPEACERLRATLEQGGLGRLGQPELAQCAALELLLTLGIRGGVVPLQPDSALAKYAGQRSLTRLDAKSALAVAGAFRVSLGQSEGKASGQSTGHGAGLASEKYAGGGSGGCRTPFVSDAAEAWLAVIRLVSDFWLAGGAIDWNALYATDRRRRVWVPNYPFQRQKSWLEARGQPAASGRYERAEKSATQP